MMKSDRTTAQNKRYLILMSIGLTALMIIQIVDFSQYFPMDITKQSIANEVNLTVEKGRGTTTWLSFVDNQQIKHRVYCASFERDICKNLSTYTKAKQIELTTINANCERVISQKMTTCHSLITKADLYDNNHQVTHYQASPNFANTYLQAIHKKSMANKILMAIGFLMLPIYLVILLLIYRKKR